MTSVVTVQSKCACDLISAVLLLPLTHFSAIIHVQHNKGIFMKKISTLAAVLAAAVIGFTGTAFAQKEIGRAHV